MDFNSELIEARNIARGAGAILLDHYTPNVKFQYKADSSVVTIADLKANEYVLSKLRAKFPLDSIVSEEMDTYSGSNKRCWYIDPLDGTSGYVAHTDDFAVHIGLAIQGAPVLGVIYKPVGDVLYEGILGEGARMNTKGRSFNLTFKPSEGLVVGCHTKLPATKMGRLFLDSIECTDLETTGGEGLRIMRLATNKAHVYVGNVGLKASSWDLCSPHAIIQSMGGTVQFTNGREVVYTGQGNLGKMYIAGFDRELLAQSRMVIERIERGFSDVIDPVTKKWV